METVQNDNDNEVMKSPPAIGKDKPYGFNPDGTLIGSVNIEMREAILQWNFLCLN